MLIGPLVAVLAMVTLASFEASEAVARIEGLASGETERIRLAPYVLTIGLFLFVYVYMPNTRVRFVPALTGAVIAGSLWTMVGAMFTRIVVYATKTMVIYAGFAVVLMFLLWVYLSWLILLLGAQLSFYLQHPEHLRAGHDDIRVTGALRERIAMSIMCLLGERFIDGGSRWTVNALADRLMVPAKVLNGIVSTLELRGLALTAEDDSVAPARDLSAIRLSAILDAVRHEAEDPRCPQPRSVASADLTAQALERALQDALGEQTLRDLLAAPAGARKAPLDEFSAPD